MKLLVLSDIFPKYDGDSGGVFVYDQCRHLVENGCQIKVISPQPWVPPGFSFLKAKWKVYASIPKQRIWEGHLETMYPRYFHLPGYRFFPISTFFIIAGCLPTIVNVRKKHKFDVIHAHTILPNGFVGWVLGKLFHVPVVCTIHGSDINVYPFRDRLTYRLTKFSLSKVDAIVAVSSKLRLIALEILKKRTDISVIRNGADSRLFYPKDKCSLRRVLHLPAEIKIILFVGNLIRIKGAHLLVPLMNKIASLAHDAYMIVVGSGEMETNMRREAKAMGLDGRIQFHGRKSHDEIPQWINAADLVVMPSLSEGFPTLVAETLACGRPIVASRVGGIPEAIDERSGILVEPNNLDELAKAVLRALERNWDAQCVTECAKNLTWTWNAQKYIELYERHANR